MPHRIDTKRLALLRNASLKSNKTRRNSHLSLKNLRMREIVELGSIKNRLSVSVKPSRSGFTRVRKNQKRLSKSAQLSSFQSKKNVQTGSWKRISLNAK